MNDFSLTQKFLKEIIHYDPDTGEFNWVEKRCGRKERVGCLTSAGHIQITLAYEHHGAHHLAWLYTHGALPPKAHYIKHINGNRSDNRIENLLMHKRC